MMTKWNNAADAQIAVASETTGSGNVITGISVNAANELVADKGITALQESDFEEIDAATVAALWSGSNSDPTPSGEEGGGENSDPQEP